MDGRTYVDYVGAFGPLILGHAHPEVVEAVRRETAAGGPFGATTPAEVELGEAIREAMPSVERLRFVSSGTEAAMSALRVARAATRRDLVVKFEGGYHGHADGLLAQAGSGLATLSLPASAGVTADAAAQTLLARYNDPAAVRALFERHPGRIAAVIVEPVAANMGVVPPDPGFLEELRELTARNGALLVFDEVITRLPCRPRRGTGPLPRDPGSHRARQDHRRRPAGRGIRRPAAPARPGGSRRPGLPGGDAVRPSGRDGRRVRHAATAGRGVYARLERLGARLEDGLLSAAGDAGRAVSVGRVGSLLTVFFRATAPRDFDEVREADPEAFARFHRAMREAGILLPPASQEAWFLSAAHTDQDVARTVEAARAAFRA